MSKEITEPVLRFSTRASRRPVRWWFCFVLFAHLFVLSFLLLYTYDDGIKEFLRLELSFRFPKKSHRQESASGLKRKILEDQHVCYGKTYEKCSEIVNKIILDETEDRDESFDIREGGTIVIRRNVTDVKEEVLRDWKTGLRVPFDQTNPWVTLKIVQAFAYNSGRLREEGYLDIEKTFSNFSAHRIPELTIRPRNCSSGLDASKKTPWLAQFSNVWVGGNGIVLVPIRERSYRTWEAHAFDIAGGCCGRDWTPVLGKEIKVKCMTDPEPVAFAVGQYHGVTYHHAVAEILPRFLSFWPLLRSLKSAQLVIGRSKESTPDVLRNMLEVLGWPRERTIALYEMEFHPVERLYVPAPFLQDARYYPKCFEEFNSNLLRRIVRAPVDSLDTKGKPVLLLIDRASSREGQTPSCRVRCVGNLGQIEQELKREFGDQVVVRVMRKKSGNSVIQSVGEFKLASIIVGAHGAGFQNMMFMDRGSYAIQISWNETYYFKLAKRRDIHFENIVVEGASQNAGNIWVDAETVVSAVRRIVSSTEFADWVRWRRQEL